MAKKPSTVEPKEEVNTSGQSKVYPFRWFTKDEEKDLFTAIKSGIHDWVKKYCDKHGYKYDEKVDGGMAVVGQLEQICYAKAGRLNRTYAQWQNAQTPKKGKKRQKRSN